MRCKLVRDYRFEAAHSLPRVPPTHKCSRMHGHSYRVSITIEGDVDSDLGWLMDFAEIDERVEPVIKQVDHYTLNDLPGLENPTSEILAQWLWQKIKPSLPNMVELSVSETPDSRCVYQGE